MSGEVLLSMLRLLLAFRSVQRERVAMLAAEDDALSSTASDPYSTWYGGAVPPLAD